jgi:hypothetical protein
MLRALIAAFMMLIVVEGAIRKWLLPEYSTQIFAIKDLVLFGTFVLYLASRPARIPRVGSLVVWVFWALLVTAYAAIGGFSIENLIGLRYYLAPLPLLLIIPEAIKRPEDLERVAAAAVIIAIPIGILGIIQYFSPTDSILNTYAWSTDELATTFGTGDNLAPDRPRVTGTFSYITTYTAFLSAVWVFAWIVLLHSAKTWLKFVAAASLVLLGFNMAMTGSRSLLLVGAVSAAPFAWSFVRKLGNFKSQFLFFAIALASGYIGNSVFEPFAMTLQRGDTEEAFERVFGAIFAPYATLATVETFGSGIGSTFAGLEYLGIRTSAGFDEVALDRVGIELGIPGYLFLLMLKVAMLLKAITVFKMEASRELRDWVLAAILVQASSLWQIPFHNAVSAVFYFSSIGFVYWLEGEQRRRLALARVQAASMGRPFETGRATWTST